MRSAIEFSVGSLGGTEVMRFAEPPGEIVQADVRIGDSFVSIH